MKGTVFVILGILFSAVTIPSVFATESYSIPNWVKDVAGFWAEDLISDNEFGDGITFLIDKEILKVPLIDLLKDENSILKEENIILKEKTDNVSSESVSQQKSISKDESSLSEIESYSIPIWVKDVAGFWAEDLISDNEFGDGITFLIDNNHLQVSLISSLKDENRKLGQENLSLEKLNISSKINTKSQPSSESFEKTIESEPEQKIQQTSVEETEFVLSYTMTSGSIEKIIPIVDKNSLLIEIQSQKDGEITLTIPRDLIDAKYGGNPDSEFDSNFYVIIENEFKHAIEILKTSTDRTIVISFPATADKIEIRGTTIFS